MCVCEMPVSRRPHALSELTSLSKRFEAAIRPDFFQRAMIDCSVMVLRNSEHARVCVKGEWLTQVVVTDHDRQGIRVVVAMLGVGLRKRKQPKANTLTARGDRVHHTHARTLRRALKFSKHELVLLGHRDV